MPDVAFKLALDRLRNFVANAPEPEKDGGRELAYALYVLARNGVAPVGDLRYLADTKLNALATPIAKAQIAAALAHARRQGARRAGLCRGAGSRSPPQPKLRIRPRRLRLVAARRRRAGDARVRRRRAAADRSMQRGRSASRPRAALTPYTSTQEQAWMVLAARALGKDTRSVARRRRRGAAGLLLPPAARRPTLRSRSASPIPATCRCRRWSRSAARR